MREIKFRAWDGTSWVYSECISKDGINWWILNNEDDNWLTCLDPQQYTGLKDSEDKEIYEKDVCEIWMGCKQDGYYVVEDLRELYLDMNHADSYYRITRIEVIGNIYENPELLEESK